MSFSPHGLWISLVLIILIGICFFFNSKPKYLIPYGYLKKDVRFVYTILFRLLLVSVILLPLRISFVSDKHVVVEKNLPLQIIFDVSLSMAATDVVPSRFVAAKESLIGLIQQLDGYYISLITFSGKPFVSIPFSSDISAIVAKLSSMNLGDFPPVKEFLGTALGDALLLGVLNLQQFADQESYKPGMVIMITDGDSNIGYDPLQVLSLYQKTGIPIYILGIGHSYHLIGIDSWNTPIMTDINFSLLQEISKNTGGKIYRAMDNASFTSFFGELLDNILIHQQETIQYVFWELNRYLLYLLAVAIFGLISLKGYFFIASMRKHQ